jgi:hypothetical protein
MKRKLGLLIVVGAVFCSIGTLSAADDFYVVGSGGKPLGAYSDGFRQANVKQIGYPIQ